MLILNSLYKEAKCHAHPAKSIIWKSTIHQQLAVQRCATLPSAAAASPPPSLAAPPPCGAVHQSACAAQPAWEPKAPLTNRPAGARAGGRRGNRFRVAAVAAAAPPLPLATTAAAAPLVGGTSPTTPLPASSHPSRSTDSHSAYNLSVSLHYCPCLSRCLSLSHVSSGPRHPLVMVWSKSVGRVFRRISNLPKFPGVKTSGCIQECALLDLTGRRRSLQGGAGKGALSPHLHVAVMSAT